MTSQIKTAWELPQVPTVTTGGTAMNPETEISRAEVASIRGRCECRAPDAIGYVELRDAFREAIRQRDEAREALAQAAEWFQECANGHTTNGNRHKAARDQNRADFCREAMEGK